MSDFPLSNRPSAAFYTDNTNGFAQPVNGFSFDTQQNVIGDRKETAREVMAAQGIPLNTPTSATHPSNASHGPNKSNMPNGTSSGTKRTRSGSPKPGPQSPPRNRAVPVNDRKSRVELEQYMQKEQIWQGKSHHMEKKLEGSVEFLRHSLDYFTEQLGPIRRANPGSIFGLGYGEPLDQYGARGFGNPRTNVQVNPQHPILYPVMRPKLGGGKTRPLYIDRKDLNEQSEMLEELVPVRLDIELDKLKLRDTFTWNLNDRTVPLETFADTLVEDFCVPQELRQSLATQVRSDMVEQIQDFYPHVYLDEESLDPHLPYDAYKDQDMRILIKLNITIGGHTLVDQFEWDINNERNSPEAFARQMAFDLTLSGEFTTAIAHSIREQIQLFTKSLYITGHPFDGRPIEDPELKESFLPSPMSTVFRPVQASKDYAPYLYELNEADLERTELSILRDQRRQKRSTNRRGGPALPDLRERQQTIRSMVLSSMLPGSSETIEGSRIFKYTRTSGRSRRPGVRLGEESEEEEEESEEESLIGSPALSNLQNVGTARTRGMRGAATAAQAAMRANLGRSATPELASLHEHGTRASRRFGSNVDGTREDSTPAEPDRLLVKLQIPRDRFRQWSRNIKAGRFGLQGMGIVTAAEMNRMSQAPSHTSTPKTANATLETKDRAGSVQASRSTPGAQSTPKRATSASAQANGEMSPKPPTPAPAAPAAPATSAPTSAPETSAPASPEVQYTPDGRVDAPYPQTPGAQPPPPPPWLAAALVTLHEKYPTDLFDAIMRYTPINAATGAAMTRPEGGDKALAEMYAAGKIKFQWLPRIKCLDCPGKFYTATPTQTVENFEVHMKNRQHKENVEARRKKTEAAAGASSAA